MGSIFYLSQQSGEMFDMGQVTGLDKLAHFTLYGLLAATVIFAQSPLRRQHVPQRVSWLTVIVCLVYGLSDEWHQSFVPGRDVSGADVVADLLGAIVAAGLWLCWRRWRARLARVRDLELGRND
ncbi:MAG: VanZ family protein [Desulfopila sp.]